MINNQEQHGENNQLIDFLKLPICQDLDRTCTQCHRSKNIGKFIATKQGVLPVITCDECGHQMRDPDTRPSPEQTAR